MEEIKSAEKSLVRTVSEISDNENCKTVSREFIKTDGAKTQRAVSLPTKIVILTILVGVFLSIFFMLCH